MELWDELFLSCCCFVCFVALYFVVFCLYVCFVFKLFKIYHLGGVLWQGFDTLGTKTLGYLSALP